MAIKFLDYTGLQTLVSSIKGDLTKFTGTVVPTFEEIYSNLFALDENKVDKVEGKGLSTEDYTTTEKTNLSTHLGDSTIHVTSSDKTAWDGKIGTVTVTNETLEFS